MGAAQRLTPHAKLETHVHQMSHSYPLAVRNPPVAAAPAASCAECCLRDLSDDPSVLCRLVLAVCRPGVWEHVAHPAGACGGDVQGGSGCQEHSGLCLAQADGRYRQSAARRSDQVSRPSPSLRLLAPPTTAVADHHVPSSPGSAQNCKPSCRNLHRCILLSARVLLQPWDLSLGQL